MTIPKQWIIIGGACAVLGSAFFILRANRAKPAPPAKNEAFMFIKPHGQVADMKKFVLREVEAHGLTVVASGELGGAQIDREGLIDAHYAAIAQYATKLAPIDLPLTPDTKVQFEKKYGKNWDAACKAHEILNLAEAMKRLNVTDAAVAKAFEAAKGEDLGMKLMPGCYVALLKQYKVYVVNGFYGPMRSAFTDPAAKVTWFTVSWNESALPWAAFRGRVLGATDPTKAEEDSIRAKILAQRTTLGLSFVPNTGTNCVHGSASPIEALNERVIWLRSNIADDAFGTQLLAAGFSEKQIRKMLENPTVAGKPLFDLVEDTDSSECLAKLLALKPKML